MWMDFLFYFERIFFLVVLFIFFISTRFSRPFTTEPYLYLSIRRRWVHRTKLHYIFFLHKCSIPSVCVCFSLWIFLVLFFILSVVSFALALWLNILPLFRKTKRKKRNVKLYTYSKLMSNRTEMDEMETKWARMVDTHSTAHSLLHTVDPLMCHFIWYLLYTIKKRCSGFYVFHMITIAYVQTPTPARSRRSERRKNPNVLASCMHVYIKFETS